MPVVNYHAGGRLTSWLFGGLFRRRWDWCVTIQTDGKNGKSIQSSRQQTEHWHCPKRDFYRANYLCFNRFTSNIVFRQCWTVLLWLSFFKYLDMASDSTVSPPYLVPVPAPCKIFRQTVVQVTCTSVFCFSFQFRTWLNTVTMETSRWIYRQLMIEEFHNSSINK